jgi:hypothetical protein
MYYQLSMAVIVVRSESSGYLPICEILIISDRRNSYIFLNILDVLLRTTTITVAALYVS